MKALTLLELESLVQYFSPLLEGAQLQDILVNDRGLALGFRKEVHYWMILDLVPNAPGFYIFKDQCPFKKSSKSKPVSLFLNSHGKNLYFSSMEVRLEFGRVVTIKLRNTEYICELEIRLIPKQCNVLVRAHGKQVAWDRPLELTHGPQVQDLSPRSIEVIHQEWLSEQANSKKPAQDPIAKWEKQKAKDLEKKHKAIVAITAQIESDEFLLWQAAGEYLKTYRKIEVPQQYLDFVNPLESLSWNIENCFFKSKQLQAKKEGAKNRLGEVIEEIKKLEQSSYSAEVRGKSMGDLMEKGDARGRKLQLHSGGIAYCGKSAADNLTLLRRAKAWDYWLHLKDYPGAHAIIHRERNQVIPDQDLMSVAQWVARESISSKAFPEGQKVLVVVVECRFVRPIKGDKLGRVTYHSERTLSFTLRHS